MRRATLFATVVACTVNLTVNARYGAAEPKAPTSHAPRAIALEVLIVGTKGGPKDEHAAELSGPSDKVAARLRKLESEGQIVVIDRIRLTTVENQKTLVQGGRAAPVASGRTLVGRGGPPQTSYRQQSVGTLISATARVDGDVVIVELQVEKSELERRPSKPQPDDEFVPLGTETLTSQATVRIESGKTVLASGLERRADAERSGQLVLASARLLGSSSDTKAHAPAGGAAERRVRVFALKSASAENVAAVIKAILGDHSSRIRLGVDSRTNSLIVSAEKEQDLDLVENLLGVLDGGNPRQVPKESPPSGLNAIGKWLEEEHWVTLINVQGGYRIRVMTAEQKARAEKAISDYRKQLAEYREYLTRSRRRGGDADAERPTPVEMPRLATDLRSNLFLKVVSIGGDYVELEGGDVHAIVPFSSIRLILVGDGGDVPGGPSRLRGLPSRSSILGAPRGSQGAIPAR